MPKFGFTLTVCVLISIAGHAQDPRSVYVVAPEISVDPPVFRKGQLISVTATFAAPTSCQDQGLVLRLYDLDDDAVEPTYESKYLEQTVTRYDPPPPAGTRVEMSFDRFAVPSKASNRISMVAWRWCVIRIPKGLTPDGTGIIWQEKLSGTPVAGTSFHFDCPSREDLCAYRSD